MCVRHESVTHCFEDTTTFYLLRLQKQEHSEELTYNLAIEQQSKQPPFVHGTPVMAKQRTLLKRGPCLVEEGEEWNRRYLSANEGAGRAETANAAATTPLIKRCKVFQLVTDRCLSNGGVGDIDVAD
jgi:hypothetical protein